MLLLLLLCCCCCFCYAAAAAESRGAGGLCWRLGKQLSSFILTAPPMATASRCPLALPMTTHLLLLPAAPRHTIAVAMPPLRLVT